MKKVLFVTVYFPPTNAADMQRVRMSLPYLKEFGWEVAVVVVDEQYSDLPRDELLIETVPKEIKIIKVKAYNKRFTSKLGIGSIALRSLPFYRKEVNKLLKKEKFDLIFFSTTQFPVFILGAYWKKKFGVPYIIDMQDPWHSEYYKDKPKSQQPAKYWFSYRLNKYLEQKAVKEADGLMSVSQYYIDDLKARYPDKKNIPEATITFGAFAPDLEITEIHKASFISLLDPAYQNIVYIGRGGYDMYKAVSVVFKALKQGIETEPALVNLRLYFIGTSYAPEGRTKKTIYPIAEEFGVGAQVIEITRRISFYHTLATLQMADALFIPGSDDPKYTASKIYPYLLTQKPLLAVFNKASAALDTLREYGVLNTFNYDEVSAEQLIKFFKYVLKNQFGKQTYNPKAIDKYSGRQMSKEMSKLFDKVISGKN